MTSDVASLIIIGGTILAALFATSLIDECIRTLSPSEIAAFEPHHPLIRRFLDYFHRRRSVAAATLSAVWVPALVIGGIRGFPYLAGEPPPVRWLLFGGYLFVLVMFGVVVPRILGNRFRETFGFISAIPLWLLAVVLSPVTFPMVLMCRAIERRRTSDPKRIAAAISQLAQSAAAEKAISKRQAQLITRAVELSGITAADIMVSRADMHPISDTLSLSDALIEAHLHHHTRFPLVRDGDLDRVIGYVNFKDIVGALRVNPADPTLSGIKRPIEFVGAETPLPELLRLLTRSYQHIVIVRDAQQRTLGMVTLEDLIETLVGDLEDEYDTPPDFIVPLTDNRFRAGGGVTFSQLRTKVAQDFPDWDLTIHEWISAQADGKIPERFSAVYGQSTFSVRKIVRGKAFHVIIDRGGGNTPGNPPEKAQL